MPRITASFTVPDHASPGCAVSDVSAVVIVTDIAVPAGMFTPRDEGALVEWLVVCGFGFGWLVVCVTGGGVVFDVAAGGCSPCGLFWS